MHAGRFLVVCLALSCQALLGHGRVLPKTVRSLLESHDGSDLMSVIVEFDQIMASDEIVKIPNVHNVQVMGRFVTMDVDASALAGVFEDLSSNLHFIEMEKDSIWTEQGIFEEELFVVDGSKNVRRQRRAQELRSYGVEMIQGNQVTIGNSPTSVCVVDTGVAAGHPDLDFSRIDGTDRRSNIDGTTLSWNGDTRGHGTHTIGIITAISDNNVGVQSMGKIPVYVTRGLNDLGKAKESDIVDALDQCKAANAKIISLSLAGPSMNWQMRSKIRELYDDGFLILAASGNQSGRNQVFPASDPSVISVAAVTSAKTRWYGSNFGPWVEVAGPGALITSTSVNANGQHTYSNFSGTSMATPFVAASAALLWSHFPSCTNTQIRYALAYTATGETTSCSESTGYGIVQTKDAYDFLVQHSCIGANWGKTQSSDGMCSTIDVQPATQTSSTSPANGWVSLQALWSGWKNNGW